MFSLKTWKDRDYTLNGVIFKNYPVSYAATHGIKRRTQVKYDVYIRYKQRIFNEEL